MKRLIMVLLSVALFSSEVTAEQSLIDLLVEKLSKQPMWQNGAFPLIELPHDTPEESVISEATKKIGFDEGRLPKYQILESREVSITSSYPPKMTAVLIDTNVGKK